MNQKMYYTTCGFLLTGINLALIGTRFAIIGIGFGFLATIFFLKALSIKNNK